MAPRSRPAALAVAVTVLVAACVPTPANRPSPSPVGSATPGTPPATLVPTPTEPTPPASFVRPTPTPLPTFLNYTVRAGDTLTSLARVFATDVDSIAYWNRDAYPSLDPDSPTYQPDRIEAGWTLVLIPGVKVDLSEVPLRTPTPGPEAPSPAAPSPSG